MILKILLAGFSTPSAAALTLLLQRNYPDIEYVMLDRYFNDDLRLSLPPLTIDTHDAFAAIINLDGVGMSLFSEANVKLLAEFLGSRATLFLARDNINQWKNAKILPRTDSFFLSTPYTKQDMETALDGLINATKELLAKPRSQKNQNKTTNPDAPSKTSLSASTTTQNQPRSKNSEFIQSVISTCFSGVCPNNIMYELIEIFSQEHPFKVIVGSQTVYVYPKKSIALVQSLHRLIDYFSVAGNCQVLKTNITNIAITSDEFEQMIGQLKNEGYRRCSLNSFLWQIYSVIIPTRINVPRNTLKLKIRYMPNFAGMNDVPEYVHAVVSSCLVVPKNLDQLDEVFGELTQKNPSILHRIFLLSILSGSADISVLKHSFYAESTPNKPVSDHDEPQPPTVPAEPVPNKGIAQASKTGFFRRLLTKLSF